TVEGDGGMANVPPVIMEALGAGLPVISTPLGGIPEMVEHEINGELIREHDPAAICAAMERLIADPARARKFGDRGQEMAQEKFSIEANVRKIRTLLLPL